jgi:PAS domain S-box-containing protein
MNDAMNAFPRWMAVALAAALLALAIGGAWFYRDQGRAVQHAAEEQLTSIGQLKANQIATWRADRLADAAVMTESPFFAQGVARFLAAPRDANAQPFLFRFRTLQEHYINILLVDPQGNALLSLTGETEIYEEQTAALGTALRERKPILTELYSGVQTLGPYIRVIAPIFAGAAPDGPPLGAVVLVSDASRFLYPLIQSWPTLSKTAETLLIRRDGQDVLFLNDLRHQPDTALKLRIPLSRTEVPSVMAVLGRQGMFQGTDYRGVEVLAVILAIPDSPWIMVAKQDTAEIFAEWRLRALAILALFMAMAGTLVAFGLFAWQRRKKAHYKTLYLSEARQRESEHNFRLLFENMTTGFALHEMIYDPNGQPLDYRFLQINPAFEKLTGARAQDLIGRTVKEVMPNTEQYWIDTYGKVALTGEPTSYENYAREIGRYFEARAFSPGKHKFAVVFSDITDRKRAEQSIAAKNKELEQIIYVASHDLRSPLVNVDGYGRELEYAVEAIQSALAAGNTSPAGLAAAVRAALSEMTDALGYIRNSTRQMDALLKGLLKLSRSGRAALTIGSLDMNLLVARVFSSLEFAAKQAGVELRVSDLPSCKGDEVQLTQVFTNLVANALKFLDPARPGVIRISGAIEHGHAHYCVEDNGIGIAPEHQENIFELFHRLDPSRTEGEGLGLTIVRQILVRLDGQVQVESKPGEGSRFHVTLPYAKLAT